MMGYVTPVIINIIIIIYLRTQPGISGTNKITRKNKCSTGE